MKRIAIIVVGYLITLSAWGQKAQKIHKVFRMPDHAQYVRGKVLVKVKNDFKDEVTQITQRNAIAQIKDVPLNSVAPLVKPELDKHGAQRMGARLQNPTVDISKYFSINFDKNQNVEDYINQLYATGYFEIVEPEYKYKSTFQPNDPSISKQYYLNLINAFSGWDITQGDTAVVIAIVDTGGNLNHSDISANLYRNWKEYPPDGDDDDGNGFIDDYQGWDFMGADTLNVNNSNFVGDNDPSIHHLPALANVGELSHGTWAAGCASASTNNGIGIAGVGFKSRLMFTKHTADNQKTTDGTVYDPYSGMLYAANLGDIKIINCSFGGPGQSQIVQDIINYIVLDRNCVIVAAAGNDGSSLPSYPAAYDNVLSVAATNQMDTVASFSNYGTTIDLAAPGVDIYTTGYNNVYNTVSGTSFSSPITAGAAALVWAKNPTFTAQQVAEQIRVSADETSLYTANPGRNGQLGKGRLDIQRALTLSLPSIRASNPKLVNQSGFAPIPGDKAYLSFDFKNFLKSTSAGIQITVSTKSTDVTISKGTISPGLIAGGSTVSNNLTPFELTISANAGVDSKVDLLISYSDGSYSDYQYASFFVNPSFIDINSNQITTTISGIGRLCFEDPDGNRVKGEGFIFNQNSMVYEMGLIMGTSAATIYNNVRGTSTTFDEDFTSTQSIKQIVPGLRSYSEIFGELSNSTSAAFQALVVDYRSLVMKDAPYDKFVIYEYKIKNPTANALNGFYFGIFSDWDITTNGAQDAAAWDNGTNMGYVYPALTAAKPIGGIQVLTGSPCYYAIDNDSAKAGTGSFGIYNGFTKTEKYTTISAAIGSGRERLQTAVPTGDDVSHVVSGGPYNIAAGQTITVAFAVHAAANLTDLKTSAYYADTLYNYTMKATKPVASPDSVCYNTTATLNASGAGTIKWYNSFTDGTSFYTGTQYTSGNLKNDTTFYVSNADHSYESVRTPINVKVKANSKIFTSGSTTICQGDTVKLSVATADSTLWSTGQETNSVEAFATGSYSVKVKDNFLGCTSLSDTINVVVNPRPVANFTESGDLKTQEPITFTDQSTNAASWFWDFGDGQTSTSENPVHTYTVPSSIVKLTVTAANACTNTKTNAVSVITAVEELPADAVKVYPNPFSIQEIQVVIDSDNLTHSSVSLTNSIGQTIFVQDISTSDQHAELTIPSSNLNVGLYFIRLNLENKTIVRKMIKVQ